MRVQRPTRSRWAAKIEPMVLVSLAREADNATVTDLTPDLFYQGVLADLVLNKLRGLIGV